MAMALDDLEVAAADGSQLTFALTRPGEATSLVAEWTVLAGHAIGDNVFFQPDFALPAITGLGADVRLATVRDADGHLVALAPVTFARLGRVAPAARIWAHDYGPLGLPLIDREAVAAGVTALLDGLAPGRSLVVPDLPLTSPVAASFLAAAARDGRPAEIVDRHVRAALQRADGVDARAAQSSRRRKEFNRLMRRFGEHGRLTHETRLAPDDVRSRFEVFMALEAAGWKGRRGTALISKPETAEFAREAVGALADAGSARIDSLDLDGTPVAMVVTFAAGATAWTWKIAYDETWARFSPGAQLMLDLPAGIFSDATIASIDSLAAADHPMIDHLWEGRLEIGTLVIGPPGGSLAHRAGLATTRAERAARDALRRIRR